MQEKGQSSLQLTEALQRKVLDLFLFTRHPVVKDKKKKGV